MARSTVACVLLVQLYNCTLKRSLKTAVHKKISPLYPSKLYRWNVFTSTNHLDLVDRVSLYRSSNFRFDKNVELKQKNLYFTSTIYNSLYCYGFGRTGASTTPNFTKDLAIVMRSKIKWRFDDSFCSDSKYKNYSEL